MLSLTHDKTACPADVRSGNAHFPRLKWRDSSCEGLALHVPQTGMLKVLLRKLLTVFEFIYKGQTKKKV